MSWFGTDVMAVACILGGATVGGAATWALLDGGEHRHLDCAVEARAVSPRVVVARGRGAKTIVVSPDVRVHSRGDCGRHVDEFVEIHMDNRLPHMEVLELELKELESALELRLEGLNGVEAEYAFQFDRDFEAQIRMEMERVQEELFKNSGRH